ncbi:unnamed protein product [Rotaria sordida]|uniref:SUN domain-containing protein n=1 Tax=Rotaria sordida TaxID=392033 RepID=A0A813NBH7_9BILA|nr:unnamed protein product [Rotaria sordida]
MGVCIRSTKFSILTIFIISLLSFIHISSITSTDPVEQNSIPGQTDENKQTDAIDEHISQSNGNILSDSNSETKSPELVSIVANDGPIISTENKSDIIDEVPRPTASPQMVDNQSTDDQQQATPSSSKSNRSSINSFEEWKQQQLQADLLKKDEIANHNNVPSETTSTGSSKGISSSTNIPQMTSTTGSSKKGKLRKNFASASCGAKILAHNVEAQNVPSILSSSPDEYMLNPCNAKIWFVIELCESIRILNIEIANFELFSSVPKTFRVSSSDRYPAKDWNRHHLGTFNASFNRTIQSFQTMESTTYMKYVKFELLDFHGHEHYCPLSVVRVHGSNVEDEIMTMEENTNLIDSKTLLNIQDENDDDDDDNDNDNLSNDQQVGGIIGSAILDLAKRVFRRQTTRGIPSTTSMPITEINVLKTNCHQAVLHGSITNDSINTWRLRDTFKQCIAEFLRGTWSKFDTCTVYLLHTCYKLNYCCQCPLMINNNTNRNNQMISTLNLYNNPCGYYHIITNQFVCKKEKLIELNDTITINVNAELNQNISEKNLTISTNDTVMIADESQNLSNNKSMLKLNNTLLNETHVDHKLNRANEQNFSNNTSNETFMAPESQISSNITNQSSSQSSTIETINMDVNLTENSIDSNNIDEIVTVTPPPPTTTTTTTSSSSSTINNNNNEAILPIISSPWLKSMLLNTKSLPELFKIIEKLNFNLTLSNRYLQELSQHYVKKLDETQQTTDLLLKSSQAADERLENLEEYLNRLEENFTQMSSRLIKLEAWIPLILFIILCLFIWCLWSTCSLVHLRRKLKYINNEYEKLYNIKQVENNDDDDDDNDGDNMNDISLICNGIKKRKLSTDSNDSNPNRSQRVPDLPLSKIKENGIHRTEHKIKKKPLKQTQHLLSLSGMQT